ncbi:ATP-dependent DNA helicase PcrA [Deferribacter autotrophicus]|uniref:DNA 3'-5' helicase n=1 Tax=Deferribacter autotrophicus TaxID=500465 RepID=A0A5A8F4V0_9BACT|nr:UvrD-helicase domain-containing protein [Deferribacter autotrophicus]KAA0258651.1 ATP-dependent DNA helicase PcrA [Deferribacter autotrophicus]
MIDFEKELNNEQLEAVTYVDSPLLVLSGAGTGKTRVITYKIAYLIEKQKMESHRIMAVTFTNKAADEMKKRVYSLVGDDAFNLWIGTFHSNTLRILRREGYIVDLPNNFTIIDQDDRLSLLRNIVKRLGIDDKKFSPKMYLHLISNYKNSLDFVYRKEPEEIVHRFNDVFENYQSELKRSVQIDFDDMLALTLRIFLENREILDFYSNLFDYILVDEFQDTNSIQFNFLKILAERKGNICVVGDDDQSIYGWRGAEVGNIVNFDKHFDNVKIVKLERNYRSAPAILYVANNLIRNNSFRKGKNLQPHHNFDAKIEVKRCYDERDEAEFVVKQIDKIVKEGVSLSDIAVLYRTNAQSRNFEVALNRRGIPYQVIGGISFYQRKEIKDILSYLRFFNNFYDMASFIRCVKTPPRGIGDKTIEKIISVMNKEGVSAFDAAKMVARESSKNVAKRLFEFIDLIDGLNQFDKISEMISYIVEKTNYEEYIKQFEEVYVADKRINNIAELINSAVAYEETVQEPNLGDFLSSTTLQTSVDEMDDGSIKLMTIHSAKGLEFDTVFLVGLENGLFPLYSSMDEELELEEERRLCYVGVTRAKKRLFVTYADTRIVYGRRQEMEPSIFLDEMRVAKGVEKEFKDGKKVFHSKFGRGMIISIKGSGEDAKADVFFEKFGIKKMALKFLELI